MPSTTLLAFASDARHLSHDPHAIGERLRALLAEDDWLAPEHREPDPDHYRQHLLYVSPERDLSIVSLVWLPGQATPIHDHVSWCIVGVYEGREREIRYRAVDGGLEETGWIEAEPGHVEVIVPSSEEDIHRVTAAGDGPTISIHVYGADIEARGTSIYRRFDESQVLTPVGA